MSNYNNDMFTQLRTKYPVFYYENYTIHQDRDQIYLRFFYNISSKFDFIHEINILKKNFIFETDLYSLPIKNIVFQLGLIEMIRYWKSTCSPKVIVKASILINAQIIWWKNLFYKGLGEFFYSNSIETTSDDFMEIVSASNFMHYPFKINVGHKNLILVGGGKDSIVTLNLLSKIQSENSCLVYNPRKFRIESALLSGYPSDKIVEVRRITDKKLLKMNKIEFFKWSSPLLSFLGFSIPICCNIIRNKKHHCLQ